MYPWISHTLDFGLQFCEKKCGLYMDVYGIHQMQIWRTTQSAQGTTLMKARLVKLGCFVLTMPPQKNLASSSIWFVLFHYDMLCF